MYIRTILITITFLVSPCVYSKDIVRISILKIFNGEFSNYKKEVLKGALEVTQEEFGDYSLIFDDSYLNVQRGMLAVKSGKKINTFMAIATPEWLEHTIAIKIPVRRGILSYRLLSVQKSKLDEFAKVNSVEELKALVAGVQTNWVTKDVMQEHNFTLTEGRSIKSLYYMLAGNRIQYIPRGVNEIYHELAHHAQFHPNLVVEPTLALYVPLPYYIFVSPNEKRLAKRLEQGLEMMIANGSLKALFYRYHEKEIKRASLTSRKIFNLSNSFLTDGTPLTRKELWFEHDMETQGGL